MFLATLDIFRIVENKKRVGMGLEHHYLITEMFNQQNNRNKEAARIMATYGSYQNAMQVARYPNLLPLFKETIEEHAEEINILFFYVNLLKINLKYEQATDVLNLYLEIHKKDEVKVAHILNNLGILYWEQGNEKCEEMWFKANEISQFLIQNSDENYSKSDNTYIWTNIYLGYYYGIQGKWAETTIYYDTAMNAYRNLNRPKRINALRILRLSHIIQDITRGKILVEGVALTEQFNHYIEESYGEEQRPLANILYDLIKAFVNYKGQKEEIVRSYFKFKRGHQERFNFMINSLESRYFKDGIDRLLFQEIDKYLFGI